MTQTEVKIVQDKAFETIQSAVNKMVDFIRPTYGPAGNKVIIKKLTHRMVVDDGVQISRDFGLPCPLENAVVDVIREVAIRTNDRMGDGTTSSLIMLQAIINEVARRGNKNARKTDIELNKAVKEFSIELKKKAKMITSKADLKKVALISFDNEEIAEMIADTYHKLGKDGIITIDKSPSMKTYMELSDGVTLDRGYVSPYMITNPERMEASIEKPYILITDYRLTEATDILPIMEKMVKEKKQQLVLICENIEQGALATTIVNRQQGKFMLVAITAPEGDNRKVMLEDIALLTGGKLFTESKGDKLENVEISDLGRAERFIARQDESIIISPKGKKNEVAMAITSLRSAMEVESNEGKKKEIMNRLGMFTNTIAVIKVGAPTDNEQKALKYKVEDTVHAVKAAFKGGVVCGGGLSLARSVTSSPILNEALKYPARQLCQNMGMTNDEEYFAQKGAWNLVTDKKGKFMDVGVVDPVDVLIAGVESAVSIASILITSPGILVEVAKPEGQERS